jgi:hypothetical protein
VEFRAVVGEAGNPRPRTPARCCPRASPCRCRRGPRSPVPAATGRLFSPPRPPWNPSAFQRAKLSAEGGARRALSAESVPVPLGRMSARPPRLARLRERSVAATKCRRRVCERRRSTEAGQNPFPLKHSTTARAFVVRSRGNGRSAESGGAHGARLHEREVRPRAGPEG